MNKKSIPGWTIYIDEVSNGVFKVTLSDAYGRKAEIIDNATDETIERAISDAFEIEKQNSKNWNLFLYELALQKLEDTEIKIKEYNDKTFGSWLIERRDKRLIYDGKESLLLAQTKLADNWTDIDRLTKGELKYSNFVKQINILSHITAHSSDFTKSGRTWWQKLLALNL